MVSRAAGRISECFPVPLGTNSGAPAQGLKELQNENRSKQESAPGAWDGPEGTASKQDQRRETRTNTARVALPRTGTSAAASSGPCPKKRSKER